MKSLSLRVRLLITLICLMSVALLISNGAAVAALRSYLIDQVDDNLRSARTPIARGLHDPHRANTPTPRQLPNFSDYFVAFYGVDGSVEIMPSSVRSSDSAPKLSTDDVVEKLDKGTFTVDSEDGSMDYRVIVSELPQDNSILTAIALPLNDVNSTLHRLVMAEALTTTGVLGLMLLLGWYLIKNDLRPLEDMTNTAAAIAEGDLSQRVTREDSHTEVGRLGTALNSMLTQIETSFSARSASEEKLRQFAADASHELRTPLTAIRGYAEMYRQGAISDEQHLQQVMRRIEGEAKRMGLMVDDLLLLARLDQGRPLEQRPVDLLQILADVARDAQAARDDKPIQLVLPEMPIMIFGDAGRLHQVFANLISNAQEHTPDETTVKVTAIQTDDGANAQVLVVDDGPGLDEEAASKIFERFYRVDAGRSRQDGGTGLGLAIVKAIVEAHKGTITVSSSPGKGATFTVQLPIHQQ